jgi:ferredoxin
MRVRVDRQVCQGHGLCYFAAPDLFKLGDEDGRASVIADPVPEGLEDAARMAADGCPEQAITIVED